MNSSIRSQSITSSSETPSNNASKGEISASSSRIRVSAYRMRGFFDNPLSLAQGEIGESRSEVGEIGEEGSDVLKSTAFKARVMSVLEGELVAE